ncbi:hypothetical protein BDQ17DRAFT_1411214 [Cyathus striatus]|nr:hypothetical protein BDQ17DRAFT_1411214 [Cyathus striatus]
MSTGALRDPLKEEFIVAPHETCQSCSNSSGPKFFLTALKGPSNGHRDNIIPKDEEYDSVLSNISYASAELGRLDEEIAYVHQSLAALQQRKEVVQKFKFQEESYFSPIRRLPQEILRHMFYLVHLDHLDIGVVASHPEAHIRVITQVSSYWRWVAESYPLLWSTFYAFFPTEECRPLVGSMIEKCIKLSKELPLDVRFGASCNPNLLEDRCFQVLVQSAYRWKKLYCANHNLFDAISARVSVFPRLRSLELYEVHHSFSLNPAPELAEITVYHAEQLNISVTSQAAPSLTRLTLNFVSDPLAVFSDLSWSHITHLTSDMGLNGELFALLRNMPNLVFLSFNGITRVIEPITLPQLQTLTLGKQVGFQGGTIEIASFTTPRLKTLYLDRNINTDDILQFLHRSQCPLEELKVTDETLDERWGADELRNVKKLCLSAPCSIYDDLYWLTWSSDMRSNDDEDTENVEDVETLFPQLETLDLEDMNYVADVDFAKGLITMLTSRLPPVNQAAPVEARTDTDINDLVCHLKSATVIFKHQVRNEDALSILRDFLRSDVVRQPGVHVSIGYFDLGSAFIDLL